MNLSRMIHATAGLPNLLGRWRLQFQLTANDETLWINFVSGGDDE